MVRSKITNHPQMKFSLDRTPILYVTMCRVCRLKSFKQLLLNYTWYNCSLEAYSCTSIASLHVSSQIV